MTAAERDEIRRQRSTARKGHCVHATQTRTDCQGCADRAEMHAMARYFDARHANGRAA